MTQDIIMIELAKSIGIIGIVIQVFGFIFMLRYWSDPYERHIEEWEKFQKILHPKDYEKRIKRDFNYWRNYQNKSEPSPHGEWFVSLRFAKFWRTMKITSFFSIIFGLMLQIVPIIFS